MASDPPKTQQDALSRSEAWLEDQTALAVPIQLSIIIPAYNEERRLPLTLVETIDYFDQRVSPEPEGFSYEILVIDDGSSDHTASIVKKFEKIRHQLRLLRLPVNSGKGRAVQVGMLNARGNRVLFMDADGATPIAEFERLNLALDQGAQVAFGSRALISNDTKVDTVWYRKYPGRVFNFLVNSILLGEVADTQCGFKLFTAKAAHFLFSKQTLAGFGFDVEILYLARKAAIPSKEVPVNWSNVPGSKVSLLRDSLRMFLEIVIIKARHKRVQKAVLD
jgi:dolichyl-phosphate beta-glucosyltransferase